MTDTGNHFLKESTGVAQETMQLNGLVIKIIRSSRRKTLSLEVGHQGVAARAPQKMRRNTIRQFIIAKENWIRRHLENLPAVVAPIRLIDGSQLQVLGDAYSLLIVKGRKPAHIADQQQIVVPVVGSHLPLEQSVRRKLIRWYKQLALQHLERCVAIRIRDMLPDHTPPTLKIRDYKRRWGSCNHRGDLSFNWRIIMAPESVMEYVVIHEIAHLREFNHSRRFWRIVEQQMPDWKAQQQWLSDHGSSLYRF
ncbi:MAG: M48 family metallopeptidase [Gammaproteobacteria bacterium]|nr:M48 family metallopeptidase [Gammaproteobacteria bacterium]